MIVVGPESPEPALPPELGAERPVRPRSRAVRRAARRAAGRTRGRARAPWQSSSPATSPASTLPCSGPWSRPTSALPRRAGRRFGRPAADDPRRSLRRGPSAAVRPRPRSSAKRRPSRLLAGGETSLRVLLAALEAREVPEIVWRPIDPGGCVDARRRPPGRPVRRRLTQRPVLRYVRRERRTHNDADRRQGAHRVAGHRSRKPR